MDYLGEIAKGGFGYLLFIGAILVIFNLYKEVKRLNEQRITDYTSIITTIMGAVKDLGGAVENLQKSVDSNNTGMQQLNDNIIQRFKK